MTGNDQKQLGKTSWAIADQLRGSMNADDFRDYMLSFLFLRYLSDNYEAAAQKELGSDYPDPASIGNGGKTPLSVSLQEIIDNDCNLNISRYISTAEPEKCIELDDVHADLVKIEAELAAAKARHNTFLIDLGLAPLP